MRQRRHARTDGVFKAIVYLSEAAFFEGVTKNIGAGGMFIQLRFSDVEVGQQVELELFPGEPRGQRLPAIVAHMNRYGLGIKVPDACAKQYTELIKRPLTPGVVTPKV